MRQLVDRLPPMLIAQHVQIMLIAIEEISINKTVTYVSMTYVNLILLIVEMVDTIVSTVVVVVV
jgi:hypothetical protein